MPQPTNTNPKVAIIIPIYNVEKYLRECLDSVCNQTYKNISIILVDDGSTDKSASIAKEFFDKDERVVLITKANGAQGSARNAGIEYLLGGFEYELLSQTNNNRQSNNNKQENNEQAKNQQAYANNQQTKDIDSKNKDSMDSITPTTYISKATLKPNA
ncbi:glycosyltransferase family 2 protein, partial [Helicobacter sp. CLO-3]|uniref:glycosyltransferase family 2 protein n=1 Tax=Helicobacter sp. CLO-3 TaxID=211 RepID=UPI0012E77580